MFLAPELGAASPVV